MKSHQLFICEVRLNVLLKTNFHIIHCEDVGGCHVEGPAVCCTVQGWCQQLWELQMHRYSRKSS